MNQDTIPVPTRIPRCSRTLASLIAMGVRGADSYEPERALGAVGEHMSPDEREAATGFLRWLTRHGRTVDRATVQAVWMEWKEECERGAAPASAPKLSAQTLQRIARGVQKHGLAPSGLTGQQVRIQLSGGAHG